MTGSGRPLAAAVEGRLYGVSWWSGRSNGCSIDLEHRPDCGDELKITADILAQSAIAPILRHLGLDTGAPPRAHALGRH